MKLDEPKQSNKPCPECQTNMRVKTTTNLQYEVVKVHTCPACHHRISKVNVAATIRYREEHGIKPEDIVPTEKKHKRIFIISPYTHDDPEIVSMRVVATERYFLKLIADGHFPVSVIVACHHLTERYKIPATYNFWSEYCTSEMSTCDEVHMLKLLGWESSVGVKSEREIAASLGQTVQPIEVEWEIK
jgi:hypothetical protein